MRLPIPEFKVLLYGPDLPKAGMRARAHFEGSVLVIQGKGRWFTIQGDKLSLKTGGYDGRQWLLTWYTPSGLATAMLQSEEAVQAFIKLAPPEVSNELKRVRRIHGRRGNLLRVAMLSLVLIVLVLVLASTLFWVFREETNHWPVDWHKFQHAISIISVR